ncbi:MAG: TonB-dependent receptor [Nitrospirae bacterium]|nr:TonB-dependent receptor [Nitrospirota bacterium]
MRNSNRRQEPEPLLISAPFLISAPSLVIFIAVLILLSAPGLYAEDTTGVQGNRLVQLEEAQVTQSEVKEELETPNMDVVKTEFQIRGIGSTIDGVLKRQAGVDVQRSQVFGGFFDDGSFKLRGFGSGDISLFLDGRPMNSPGLAGSSAIDWSSIILNDVEKIEIVKGVGSPRDDGGLGGYINLITKKPAAKPSFELSSSIGSYATRDVSFYHGWKPGSFEYSISGGLADGDGYLRNGDSRLQNAQAYLAYSFPWNGKLTVSERYVEFKRGFIVNNRVSRDYNSSDYGTAINGAYPASDGEIAPSGMGGNTEVGSWWKDVKLYSTVGYVQNVGSSVLKLDVWDNYGDREAYNTNQAQGVVYHKKFFDDRSYGADASFALHSGRNSFTLGVDYGRLADGGAKNLQGDYRQFFQVGSLINATRVGAYLMDDIALSNSTILTPGLRYSSYDGKAASGGQIESIGDVYAEGFTPTLKLTYLPDSANLAYVSVARALRLPAPQEQYWHYSRDAMINASSLPLKKEDGITVQAGWRADLPNKSTIKFSPYYYYVTNYIHFDSVEPASFNIDHACIYGIEFEGAQQLGSGFSFFMNYTFQWSKTANNSLLAKSLSSQYRGFDQIPGLPEHKANVGLQFKGPKQDRIALYLATASSQTVIYNDNTSGNTNSALRNQASYATLDAEYLYPIGKYLKLTAFVYNILDKQYSERFGFESAGRNFGVGIRGNF